MRYLDPAPFSIPPPAQVACCEACVYGRGDHAAFCEAWQRAFDSAVRKAFLVTLDRGAALLDSDALDPARWLDDGGLVHDCD